MLQKGFKAGAMRCGIRKSHTKGSGDDPFGLCLQRIGGLYDQPRQGIADFTDKGTSGLRRKAQAVIVNSGNANACSVWHGECKRRQAKAGARALGVLEENVIVASTGVIGQTLPVRRQEPCRRDGDETLTTPW